MLLFPILSFRAKARNLFRLRSGKGCEDSGELEAPCFQRIGRTVFHADSITKENGNGKRKRSLGCARDDETRKRLFPFLFNLLRKPTPPRCARQPLPREGARVDTPSFLWKEVPRRGGGWMGISGMKERGEIVSSTSFARVPYPPLTRSPFPLGKVEDTRSASAHKAFRHRPLYIRGEAATFIPMPYSSRAFIGHPGTARPMSYPSNPFSDIKEKNLCV